MVLNSLEKYFGVTLYGELQELWQKFASKPTLKLKEIISSQYKGIYYFTIPFIINDTKSIEKLAKLLEIQVHKLPKLKSKGRRYFLKEKLKKSFYNLVEISLGASLEQPECLAGLFEYFAVNTPKFFNFVWNSFLVDIDQFFQSYEKYKKKHIDEPGFEIWEKEPRYNKKLRPGPGFEFWKEETEILGGIKPVIKSLIESNSEVKFSDDLVRVAKVKRGKSKNQLNFDNMGNEKITSAYIKILPFEFNKALFSTVYDEELIDDSISVLSEISLQSMDSDTKKSVLLGAMMDELNSFYRKYSEGKIKLSSSSRLGALILKAAITEYFIIVSELELILKKAYFQEEKEVDIEELNKEILENHNYSELTAFFNLRTVSDESKAQLLDNLIILGNIDVLFKMDKFGNFYYVHLADKIFENLEAVKKIVEYMVGKKREEELGEFFYYGNYEKADMREYILEFGKENKKVVKSFLVHFSVNYEENEFNDIAFDLLKNLDGENEFVSNFCLNLLGYTASYGIDPVKYYIVSAQFDDLKKFSAGKWKIIDSLKNCFSPNVKFDLKNSTLKGNLDNLGCFRRETMTHNWREKIIMDEDIYQYLITKLKVNFPKNFLEKLNYPELLKIIFKDIKIVNYITGDYFNPENPNLEEGEKLHIGARLKVTDILVKGLERYSRKKSFEEMKNELEGELKLALEELGFTYSIKLPVKKTLEEIKAAMKEEYLLNKNEFDENDKETVNEETIQENEFKPQKFNTIRRKHQKLGIMKSKMNRLMNIQKRFLRELADFEIQYFSLRSQCDLKNDPKMKIFESEDHPNTVIECIEQNRKMAEKFENVVTDLDEDISLYTSLQIQGYGIKKTKKSNGVLKSLEFRRKVREARLKKMIRTGKQTF